MFNKSFQLPRLLSNLLVTLDVGYRIKKNGHCFVILILIINPK